MAPTANVYVTVSAAFSPSQEANGSLINPSPLPNGLAQTTTNARTSGAPLAVNFLPDGGVSFTVQGANNRDFYGVRVTCGDYSTVLTVLIGADGAGTTQVVYPPTGTCTATLEIPKQINRPRVLATITFTIQ